jgi:hypothetical protein
MLFYCRRLRNAREGFVGRRIDGWWQKMGSLSDVISEKTRFLQGLTLLNCDRLPFDVAHRSN